MITKEQLLELGFDEISYLKNHFTIHFEEGFSIKFDLAFGLYTLWCYGYPLSIKIESISDLQTLIKILSNEK